MEQERKERKVDTMKIAKKLDKEIRCRRDTGALTDAEYEAFKATRKATFAAGMAHRVKRRKQQQSSTRCPKCGFRIRGKGHEEGNHHRSLVGSRGGVQ